MNETDERLSHARQLLKKYQNKKVHENGSSSSPMNGQGTLNILSQGHPGYYHEESGNEFADHDHSYGHSESTSRPCSTSFADGVQRNASFTNYQHDPNVYYRHLLQEKEQNLNDVTAKLQALHTHYAELHNAYNLLSQSLNSASPEYAQQISQLQTALAVAIEEKTTLQNDLRVTVLKLQEIEAQKLTIQEEHQRSARSSTTNEMEVQRLQLENQRLSENLKSQSVQIETQRKESSSLEAKILMIQQDRNDTQARLKNLYSEKEHTEKLLEQLKSELNMKEIYIRQLTRHSTNSNPIEDEKAIRSLTEEKLQLLQEVESRKFELLESQREMAAIRQHYESCMRELNENIFRLETEFKTLATVKKDLESENYILHSEIDSLKVKVNVPANVVVDEESSGQHDNHSIPTIDPLEVQALRNSLKNMQQVYDEQIEKIRNMNQLVDAKNAQVASLEENLFEYKHEIENLRHSLETRKTIENDVVLLSEQLQNERATVGRAVAQNLELKEQLGELQDKLVQMANESAQREDERHTALRTIHRLKEQIEDMNSKEGFSFEKETYDQDTQTVGLEQSTTLIREIVREPIETTDEEQQTNLSLLDASIDEIETHGSTTVQTSHEMNHDMDYANVKYIERADNFTQYDDDLVSTNLETLIRSVSSSPSYNSDKTHDLETKSEKTVSSSEEDALLRHEMLKELEARLEKALQEKEQFKVSNDRLEYWLAALETENETIGEYISIYRFQRNLIQKRLSEKDALIAQLQNEKHSNQIKLDELHQLIHNLMFSIHQSANFNVITNINDTLNVSDIPKSNGVLSDDQKHDDTKVDSIHKMLEIVSDLKARQSMNNDIDPLLHCTECKGKLITL